MPANYQRPAFTETNFKKGKVAAQLERITKKLQREDKENTAKTAAKKRDQHKCRWPHPRRAEREACRRSRWLEGMHWRSKSIEPTGAAQRKCIITGCPQVHQGPGSIHAGQKRIKPVDPQLLMDGPVIFEEQIGGRWVVVGVESHVGVLTKLPVDPLQFTD
jgi:hypothetical protein